MEQILSDPFGSVSENYLKIYHQYSDINYLYPSDSHM